MIDFAISTRGDLIFEDFNEDHSLALSFKVSDNKPFQLSFHSLRENSPLKNNGFQLTFIHDEKSELTHKAKVISNIEEKIQRIRIALSTERGELPLKKQFGSDLSRYRHGDIHSKAILSGIKDATLEAIRGILDNPSVQVRAERGAGNFYSQNINIYVYENGVRIFKFSI